MPRHARLSALDMPGLVPPIRLSNAEQWRLALGDVDMALHEVTDGVCLCVRRIDCARRPPMSTLESGAGDNLELGTLKFIHKVRAKHPEMADELMSMARQEQRHRQRLDWAPYVMQVIRLIMGFAALLVLTWASLHFVKAGATAAASIAMGVGAGTVVAIFVTGRVVGTRSVADRRHDQVPGACPQCGRT